MENEMNAEKEVFISKDHQIAMALDDDIISVETKLKKGDAPPLPADPNISPESKAPEKIPTTFRISQD